MFKTVAGILMEYQEENKKLLEYFLKYLAGRAIGKGSRIKFHHKYLHLIIKYDKIKKKMRC